MSGEHSVSDLCNHGNEPSRSIKGEAGLFLVKLGDCHLVELSPFNGISNSHTDRSIMLCFLQNHQHKLKLYNKKNFMVTHFLPIGIIWLAEF
jgi:hypothetical protein